jgi:hypothetical protein
MTTNAMATVTTAIHRPGAPNLRSADGSHEHEHDSNPDEGRHGSSLLVPKVPLSADLMRPEWTFSSMPPRAIRHLSAGRMALTRDGGRFAATGDFYQGEYK